MVLLNNLSKAKELTNQAINDEGLAQERYGIYMESTTAKVKQLTDSLQQLWTSVLNSGIINYFIDGTRGVLDFINSLGGVVPVLVEISGMMIIINRQKFAENIIKGLTDIKNIGSGAIDFFKTFATGVQTLGTHFLQLRQGGAGVAEALKGTMSYATGATTAVSSLSSAVTVATGVFGALVAVLGLVYMAYQKNKQEHEAMIASYQEQTTEYRNSIQATQELKNRYEELSNIENKTKQQTEELAQVQHDLCEALNLSNTALGNTDSLEKRIGMIDSAIQKENEYNLLMQKQVVADAQKKYDKVKGNSDAVLMGVSGDVFDEASNFDSFMSSLKKDYGELIRLEQSANGMFTLMVDKSKMSIQEYADFRKDMAIRMGESGVDEQVINNFTKGTNEIIKYGEALQTALDSQYELQAGIDIANITDKLNINDVANLTKEQVQKIKDEFNSLENIGDKDYANFLNEFVDSLGTVEDKAEETGEAVSEGLSSGIESAREVIVKTTKDIGSLQDMYSQAFSDEGELELPFNIEDVESLRETFGDLGETFEEFESVLTDQNSTAQDVQDAFDNLTTAYIYQSGILDALNTSNRDMIVSQLELQGVQNASELITNGLAEASQALTEAGYSLSSITIQQANDFLQEANCSDTAKQALYDFLNAKISANSTTVDTSADVAQLGLLASQANIAASALLALQMAKNGIEATGNGKGDGDDKAKFTPVSTTPYNLTPTKPTPRGGGGGGSKKNKKSGSGDKPKYVEQGLDAVVDVLEEKGKAIEDKIKEIDARIELAEAQGNESLRQQLQTDKANVLKEQLDYYKNSITEVGKYKEKYVKALNDKKLTQLKGIDIENADKTTVDKIQRIFDRDINATKDENAKNSLENKKAMATEYLNAIVEINEKAKDYSIQAIEQQTKIIEHAVDIIDSKYKPALDDIEMRREELDASPVSEDLGADTYYKNQIEQLDLLGKEYEIIKNKLAETMKIEGMSNKSEVVRDLQKELLSLGKERMELTLDNIDLDFDIDNIPIDKLEDVRSMISDSLDIADFMGDLDTEIELNVEGTEILEKELDINSKIIQELKEKQALTQKGSVEYEKYEQLITEAMNTEMDLLKDLIGYYEDLAEAQANRDVYGSMGKDEWEYQNDKKIEALENQKKALDEQNEKLDKQRDMKEKILRIKELEEKLANLKSQRTIQELTKDETTGEWQWQYSADEKAIKETEKELANAKLDIQRQQEEEAKEMQENAIQAEIDALQQEADDKEKEYEEQERNYIQFYRNQLDTTRRGLYDIDSATTNGIDNVSSSTKNGLEKLKGVYKNKMNEIYSGVKEVCAKIWEELNRVGIDGKPAPDTSTRDALQGAVKGGNLLGYLGLGALGIGKTIAKFDTGGGTGNLPNNGGLAIVHDKEIILNKADSQNFVQLRNTLRDLNQSSNLKNMNTDNSKHTTIQHLEVNYDGYDIEELLDSCNASLNN